MILLFGLLSGMAVAGGLIGVIAGVVGSPAPRRAPLYRRWQAVLRGSASLSEDARLRRRTLIAVAVVVVVAVWLLSGTFVAGSACTTLPCNRPTVRTAPTTT